LDYYFIDEAKTFEWFQHKILFFMQLLGPYSVSKTALLGLVKAMAASGTRMNIRVNAIAPGIIQTKFSGAVSTDCEKPRWAFSGLMNSISSS
jgi:NAD(P)-dependent dehydrogenase (short-subunit alcohol dehydrogenase family)